jgi:signal transduction histidine kinase
MASQLVLQLQLPADARLLPRTRQAVSGYLEEVGTEPDDRADVVLALDEACANVIRHAFPDGPPGTIRLRAEIDGDAVTVQVEDDGRGLTSDSSSSGGKGLAGLRERVAALGGRFGAGPRAEGGFRVRAELPLAPRNEPSRS